MELTCEKEVLLVTSREKKPAANSTFINKQSKILNLKFPVAAANNNGWFLC
jgi:hypothetical protein